MRRLVIAGIAALAVASSANAYPGPFHIDSAGHCRAANGATVPMTICKPPPPGATAICSDGTYGFTHSQWTACKNHGHVDRWL